MVELAVAGSAAAIVTKNVRDLRSGELYFPGLRVLQPAEALKDFVMATLMIRLSDEKHVRLRQLAERRKVNVNKLIDELSTVALAEFDAETRFRARAALGSPEKALRLLNALDRRESREQG